MLFTVSSHHITVDWKVSSEKTQDRNRMLLWSHQPLQPPPAVRPMETQDGKTVEIVTDFIALDSRITADADCVVLCLVAQLCPTLFDLMDCSPPGSSVYGIL